MQQDTINEHVIHTRREAIAITISIRDSAREVAEATSTREREAAAANNIIKRVSVLVGSGYYVGDHQKINQTKVQVDIDLLPYWGNIDDESKIHLFDRPAENYVPITVPGTAIFTDTEMVSYYLINFMY